MFDQLKAARSLGKLVSTQKSAPVLHESSCCSKQGDRYDLYHMGQKWDRTLLAVHGVTVNGEKDPRLIHFARTFARAGLRVANIELRGLKSCSEDVADLQTVVNVVEDLQRSDDRPVAVIAFSFGAGVTLTAATSPQLASKLQPLLLVGSYYDLGQLWNSTFKRYASEPEPEQQQQWYDYIYVQLMMAYRHRSQLDLSSQEGETLFYLLKMYCSDKSLPEKKAFYQNVLKPRDILTAAQRDLDFDTLAQLSPRGKLSSLRAPVLLLHDAHDGSIGPEHSRDIQRELTQYPSDFRREILVTPLLSHVNHRSLFKVGQLFKMVNAFGWLFRPPYGS